MLPTCFEQNGFYSDKDIENAFRISTEFSTKSTCDISPMDVVQENEMQLLEPDEFVEILDNSKDELQYQRFWSDEGPNLYTTQVKDFVPFLPTRQDYIRWKRPDISSEHKKNFSENDMDLVVIGCKATCEETSGVSKRLYCSHFVDSRSGDGIKIWERNGSSLGANSRLNFLSERSNIENHQVPVVHMFCLDKSGRSICVNVHGFFPYIYTEVDNRLFDDDDDLKNKKDVLCERYAIAIESWIHGLDKKKRWAYKPKNKYKPKVTRQNTDFMVTSDMLEDEGLDFGESWENSTKKNKFNRASEYNFAKRDNSEDYEIPITHKQIVSIDIVYNIPLDGAHKEMTPMFRIKFATPSVISRFRKQYMDVGFMVHNITEYGDCFLFGGKNQFDKFGNPYELLTYDSCIRFENRFFIDTKLHGGAWFKISKEQPKQIRYFSDDINIYEQQYNWGDEQLCVSRSQIEIDIHYSAIESYDQYDSKNAIYYNNPVPGVRILAFDIECIGEVCRFPNPQKDPLVCINVYATKDSRYPTIFSSNEIDYDVPAKIHERDQVLSICFSVSNSTFERNNPKKKVLRGYSDPNPTVFSFRDERDMLKAFCDFINIFDPDIITGYNSSNFDIPQVVERCKVLGIEDSLHCSRLLTEKMVYEQKQQHHEKKGAVAFKVLECTGRLMWDVHPFMKEDFTTKIPSYTLNSVANFLFKETKDDMNHLTLPVYYRSGAKFRDVVRIYCERDAFLALRIFLVKQIWPSRLEASRVAGTRLEQEESDGAAAKSFPHITRCANADKFVMPWRFYADRGEKFEGAIVQKPVIGFHQKFLIAFLDYLSEYPATMRAWNICMSTYVSEAQWPYIKAKYGPDCCNVCPFVGHRFLKPEYRVGILPKVQTFLMNKRAEVKLLMKKMISGCDEHKVSENKQNQLKLKGNGLYGVTGVVNNGFFWKIPVAESVTAWARNQINETVALCKQMYPDCEIIYGDTDSVMVVFKDLPFDPNDPTKIKDEKTNTFFERMTNLAAYITTKMKPPNELKAEFIGYPMLLISRKKYAVLKREKPTDDPKMDIKGLETARRSTCTYTSETQKECIRILLEEVNVQKALDYVISRTIDLASFKFNYSDLVLSTRLNKKPDFKRDTKTVRPQEYLYQRMKEIDPDAVPNLGDRVPYLIRMADGKKQKNFSKAIHPTELLGKNAQKIDISYYFERQFLKSISTIFKYIDPPKDNSWIPVTDKKFAKKTDGKITSFFSPVKNTNIATESIATDIKMHDKDTDENDDDDDDDDDDEQDLGLADDECIQASVANKPSPSVKEKRETEPPKIKANRLEFESRLRMEFKNHMVVSTTNDVYWIEEHDPKIKQTIDALLEIDGSSIAMPTTTVHSSSSTTTTTTTTSNDAYSTGSISTESSTGSTSIGMKKGVSETHDSSVNVDALDENVDEPMFFFPKPKTNIADHDKTTFGTKDLRSFDKKYVQCVLCTTSIKNPEQDEARLLYNMRAVKLKQDYSYSVCKTCFNLEMNKKFAGKYQYIVDAAKTDLKKEKKDVEVKNKRERKKTNKKTTKKRKNSCSVTSDTKRQKSLDGSVVKTEEKDFGKYDTSEKEQEKTVPEVSGNQKRHIKIEYENSGNSNEKTHDEITIWMDICNDIRTRTDNAKKIAVAKWETCKTCMGSKFEKDACSNYECKNWFQRGIAKADFTGLLKKKVDLLDF